MEEKINITPVGNELTILTGKALERKDPLKVVIDGTIDAPARWIEKKTVDFTRCNVTVNRTTKTIVLNTDETNPFGAVISGKLELSDEYVKMKINDSDYISNFDMAKLFKMNRTYFDNKTVAMNLVSDLQNFKAKVDKDLENATNNRGDRKILVNQAVEHNLPDSFHLNIPIFKGIEKSSILCELYVDPDDFTVTVVSADANDQIESMRDGIIYEVLNRIKAVSESIVIIETI